MKKFLLVIIIFSLFAGIKIFDEENVVTDSGKKVILHDNGTWEYYVEKKVEVKKEEKEEIEKVEYNKSESSKSEVKGGRKAYSIWYDDSKWINSKVRSKKNNNIEYEFSNLNKNSYAKMVYEKTSIPIDTLKELIIFNAKKEGVNVQLLKSEYRNVNNQDLLLIKYSSIIQGYSHIFYGYIFSNKKGSYQFLTKTEVSLFDEIKDDLDELINGLEIH